jgi:hypothetical protein
MSKNGSDGGLANTRDTREKNAIFRFGGHWAVESDVFKLGCAGLTDRRREHRRRTHARSVPAGGCGAEFRLQVGDTFLNTPPE